MKCPVCRVRKLVELSEPEMRKGVLCTVHVCTKCVISFYRAVKGKYVKAIALRQVVRACCIWFPSRGRNENGEKVARGARLDRQGRLSQ